MKSLRQGVAGMAGWGVSARGPWRVLLLASAIVCVSRPAVAGLFDDTPTSKQAGKSSRSQPPLNNSAGNPGDSGTGSSKANSQESAKPVVPPKLAIPSEAARKAAEKQIRDVMADDLVKAKTPEDKKKIASQMLQTADGTSEAASKYELLRDAESLAADAGDVETAIAANTAVASAFEPDMSSGALDPLQKFSRLSLDADAESKLCDLALAGLRDALLGNHFDAARQFGRLATGFAHKTSDKDLGDKAGSAMALIATCESEYTRVAPMEATLKKTPADPAANAAIGRYECFAKGNWSVGLPMLAKGSNETLKHAAIDELKPPATSVEQSAVGDAWWGMAEGLPPAIAANVRAHGAGLYARAEEGLTGLSKLKAQQRIAQVQPAAPKPQLATGQNPKPAKPVPSDDGTSTSTDSPEINGPADVIKAVPPDMYPKTLTDWTDERQGAVNQVLRQKLYRQKGTFNIVVQELLPTGGRINSRSALFGKISFRMILRFDSDSRVQLQSLHVGSPCTVTGDIYYARFEGMELIVDMDHCTRLR
jgi:hypothetical protein